MQISTSKKHSMHNHNKKYRLFTRIDTVQSKLYLCNRLFNRHSYGIAPQQRYSFIIDVKTTINGTVDVLSHATKMLKN